MAVISLHTIFLLSLVALGAGFVDGVAGGGGLLTLPALFITGLPAQICIGSNKVASFMGVVASSYTYLRKGILKPSLLKAAITATLIGSLMGALTTHLISSAFFKKLLPIIIIAIVIYLLWPKKVLAKPLEPFRPKKLSSSIIGSILGFYDGFIGPGTGSFWATAMMAIYKLDIVTASGIARFMNLVSTSVAVVTFMLLKSIDYRVGLAMGSMYMLGSFVGAHSAIRFGSKFIRPIFLVVVIVLAIKMILAEWFKIGHM